MSGEIEFVETSVNTKNWPRLSTEGRNRYLTDGAILQS